MNEYQSAPAVWFAQLPEDMQVFISDLAGDRCPGVFPIKKIRSESLPLPIGVRQDKERGVDHAKAMDLDKTPPILTAWGHLIDGKHRAYKAVLDNVEILPSIDLTDCISKETALLNSLGVIQGKNESLLIGPSSKNEEWLAAELKGATVEAEITDGVVWVFEIESSSRRSGEGREILAALKDQYGPIRTDCVIEDSDLAIAFWQAMLDEGIADSVVLTDGRALEAGAPSSSPAAGM